jgi:hypothetical protein
MAPRAEAETGEWWVDENALPDVLWARLSVGADGTATVLDPDGQTHRFASRTDAANWLSENDFMRASTLEESQLLSLGMSRSDLDPPVIEGSGDVSPVSLVRRCVGAEFLRDLSAVRLLEPWERLGWDSRVTLEGELSRELVAGHELFGRPVRAVARRRDRDDVLFVVAQPDRLAVVHLTFAGSPEHPPWPTTEIFDAAWKFVDRAIADAKEYGAG